MNNFPKSQFGNGSVGFVYYDNSANNSTGLSESFDYIEFSNTGSGSPKGSFSPSVCSSPQQFRQRNNNYFRGKCNGKKYNRYHNNYMQYSKDNMTNSYTNSFSNNKRHDKRNDNDISAYYHPSMIEDPWAELEREMDPDSQDNSDPNMSEPFDRFEVDSNTNNLGDTTDSQDESQISTEESS